MARHNETGKLGEKLAAVYFTEKGYRILHQNWQHNKLEVDIIAEKDGILHFIEVKTKRTNNYGYPEDQVSKQKIRNLIEAAEEYLHIDSKEWKKIRFDILAITILADEKVEYFLIEDVYL